MTARPQKITFADMPDMGVRWIEIGAIRPYLFHAACSMGLEGLVSKRGDSSYRGGRSPHWIKVKNRQHQAFERVKESHKGSQRHGN
jgi:bifunctional non-homologous end joining protein LigD